MLEENVTLKFLLYFINKEIHLEPFYLYNPHPPIINITANNKQETIS